MARPWPAPQGNKTLQVIGDMHFGPSTSQEGLRTGRSDKIKDDVLTGKLVPPALVRVQVGDLTEAPRTQIHDSYAKAWVSGTDGKGTVSGTWRVVLGNHDINTNTSATPPASWRNADQAMTTWGFGHGRNWTLDAGFAKLIGVSPFVMDGTLTPPGDTIRIILDGDINTPTTALGFLEAELDSATKDCLIFCHAPLLNTVAGGTNPGGYNQSTSQNFSLHPDATVRDIISRHSRAKMIFAGHTHSDFGNVNWAMVKDVGAPIGGGSSRSIIAVNASSVYYTGQNSTPPGGTAEYQSIQDIKSLFVTYRPDHAPNDIELRVRDHGNRCWTQVEGATVTTRAVPA